MINMLHCNPTLVTTASLLASFWLVSEPFLAFVVIVSRTAVTRIGAV